MHMRNTANLRDKPAGNRRRKTMATETVTAAEQAAKDELAKELAAAEADAKKINDTRTGIGTRVMTGKTRGRATAVISYENFDESQPDTLPKDFAGVTTVLQTLKMGVAEPDLVELVILGANVKLYEAASDELAKFVNPSWDKAVQNQFRLVVRNYSKGTGDDLADVAQMMRVAFDKKHSS